MRKFSFLSFAVLFCCLLHSQEIVFKITREYFRSDPFRGEFSGFVNHLFNDPSMTNKITEKRTDSSLFYFQGTYTSYNPFFFKPKRVDVVLTEMEVDLDTLGKDTIYTYQLIAYANDNKEGIEDVKKEFDKIFKHYNKGFTRNSYDENPADSKIQGVTYNFFDQYHAVSPFALSRYYATETKETCLMLTIRMDTYNNRAMLPIPFYTLRK